MFKQILATLGLCALCASPAITARAAVYVEDVSGNVQEYDSVPALTMFGNIHVEYAVGIVTDSDGRGAVIYSTDGITPYSYINYAPIPCQTGDVVQSFFYYAADSDGEWEDNIIYRVDITND
jgi:hypothetical protein